MGSRSLSAPNHRLNQASSHAQVTNLLVAMPGAYAEASDSNPDASVRINSRQKSLTGRGVRIGQTQMQIFASAPKDLRSCCPLCTNRP